MDGVSVALWKLEEMLAQLDILSIGLEKSNQWEHQAKVQRVTSIVKTIIGDRNGIQSTTKSGEVLQQSSGTP